MEAEGQQFEWEYSKENVLPAKSGRKVATLSAALSGALTTRKREPAELESKIAYVHCAENGDACCCVCFALR